MYDSLYHAGGIMTQKRKNTNRKSGKRLTVKQLRTLVRFLVAANLFLLICIAVLAILFVKTKRSNSEAFVVQTGYVVCLDAGHGGNDRGALGADGRYEKDDNLKLTLAVAKILRKNGIEVVLTREDDSTISSDERSAIANNADADLFLSLHRNYAASEEACGVEAWIYSAASDKGYAIAESILTALEDIGISQNRGVKSGTQWDSEADYTVIRQTNMTSVIIEVGFISNEQDLELFDQYMNDYAEAIADAIVIWLNTYAD